MYCYCAIERGLKNTLAFCKILNKYSMVGTHISSVESYDLYGFEIQVQVCTWFVSSTLTQGRAANYSFTNRFRGGILIFKCS